MKVSISELDRLQNALRGGISLENSFAAIDELRLVAGVDIAYWTEDDVDFGICSVVVIDYRTKAVVEKVEHAGSIPFPYMAGYLAFRELPLILETTAKLSVHPDLYMFDGNGYLHERHMGIATQASFELKKPTIGIAKTYYNVMDTDFIMPANKVGMYTDIRVHGKTYGRVLRTRKDVKPIFVSCGNWIDIDTATRITLDFIESNSRLPITTRYADLAGRAARRKRIGGM